MTEAELQVLHDRATRGERLSTKEQASLDAWYAQQDQLESQLLQASAYWFAMPRDDSIAEQR